MAMSLRGAAHRVRRNRHRRSGQRGFPLPGTAAQARAIRRRGNVVAVVSSTF
jgi:hypothetical protein